MRIIYKLGDRTAVMTPSPEFLKSLPKEWSEEDKIIHVADKDLPTGTEYEIIDENDLPPRDFRNAWEFTAGEDKKESAELSNDFKQKYNVERD